MSMKATLEILKKQILSYNELERSHAKEDMLSINHIQYNEKRDMKGCYDQNALSTLKRNMKETVVLHAASDLACYST